MSRHPAFTAGREAFRSGKLDNPNKPDTIAHKEFEAGINHEYFLNLKTITNKTKYHNGSHYV